MLGAGGSCAGLEKQPTVMAAGVSEDPLDSIFVHTESKYPPNPPRSHFVLHFTLKFFPCCGPVNISNLNTLTSSMNTFYLNWRDSLCTHLRHVKTSCVYQVFACH